MSRPEHSNDYANDEQAGFGCVLSDLFDLFAEKNRQYGNSAFKNNENVPAFQLWMRLSDVRRKTVRLDQLTHLAAQGDHDALEKLIDDYRDLAVYAVIAIMVLEDIG